MMISTYHEIPNGNVLCEGTRYSRTYVDYEDTVLCDRVSFQGHSYSHVSITVCITLCDTESGFGARNTYSTSMLV
jgi:hypothetical protein